MPDIKELKNRIDGITDMRKITNAMYLIASVKLRKAREELEKTRPFFDAVRRELKSVFRADEAEKSEYFFPAYGGKRDDETTVGFLVITADKGLAGGYSRDVIKEALARARSCAEADSTKLFVVGEHGRQYLRNRGVPFAEEFNFPARNPSYHRAREISTDLLRRYDSGEIDELRVLYTDYRNGMSTAVKEARILPFERRYFTEGADGGEDYEFIPSVGKVLERAVTGYVTGFVFSAMVDSFCSEQSARMKAMDAANRNAGELLAELKLQYNHARQSEITREITEISAGYRHRRGEASGV
ncbi:MAG: ATP synthase F1 subunit gamma [Clostridia bacterium]|nr:ATP synthase F1 subunit gamma [Clostridia bacterium]